MHVVILANGTVADAFTIRRYIRSADMIICANGGANHADKIDIRPDIVIGDMDSLSPKLRTRLEAQNVRLILFPAHKDETDLELALL
jgi:thiamine pyrophosphokinase